MQSTSPLPGALPAALQSYPAVVQRLLERGAHLTPKEDDARFALENHIGTELMALFRDEGAPETFEALHAFTRQAVYEWILSLLRGSSRSIDALEILQDTYINVYKYNQSFRHEHNGSFRVWVRTIAGNLIRRAYSRRPLRHFEDMPEGLQEPADKRPGPRLEVEQAEESAELRRAFSLYLAHYRIAFDQLSDRDRQAMQLVEVDGLSYKQAGALLGVRASNMKMILFRARKRLVAHMRRAMGGFALVAA